MLITRFENLLIRFKMEAILERDGLDVSNVQCWEGRPRRTRRPPPKTYWEEYVETDPWYIGALLEDVPEEEMRAACFDEDFAEGEGEESEDSEVESEGEDGDYDPCEVSDECGESYEEESEATGTGSDADSAEEEVHRSPEGERRGEAEDGEGARSSVG